MKMKLDLMRRAGRFALLLLPVLGGVACASKSVLLMPKDGGADGGGTSGAAGTGGSTGAAGAGGGGATVGTGGGGVSGTAGGGTTGTWAAGGGPAVAFQVDVAHSGNQPASTLTPPLTRAWSVDFGDTVDYVSYPLIVDGRVFVTTSADKVANSTLRALDLATGKVIWGPLAIGGANQWSNAAYDDGRIYVVISSGLVTAFDPASGATLWSKKMPGQNDFSSPPTAGGGMVYLGGAGLGGTFYAVDGKTGTVMWTADLGAGSASPALSSDKVFFGCTPATAYAFARTDGTSLWHPGESCGATSGATSVFWQGRLWVRDSTPNASNVVLDATSGAALGSFSATVIPAFADQRGFFRSDYSLTALDATTRAVLWDFAGDGALVSAPLVVNGVVYIGSRLGALYALDPTNGTVRWSDTLPWGISYSTEYGLAPVANMNAGGNALVVPAGNHLVCYR